MKELSCGIIVTDKARLLAIVPWGKKNSFDIPKGHLEEGEDPVECAVRELWEETNIKARGRDLIEIGRVEYLPTKDLHLFLYPVHGLDGLLGQCKCNSYFVNSFGKNVLEATGFDVPEFDDPRFYKGLQPILKKIKASL